MKNQCEICGRETNRIYHIWGYTLCSKHMHQYHKYGKFLDNNPRTNNDLNDFYQDKDNPNITYFNLYNQKNECIGHFIVDTEDVSKIRYKKWRKSHGHVVTGLPAKGTQQDLTHILLDFDPKEDRYIVIDHINGDALDNRKQNLRICTQGENCCNKKLASNNTSGFNGISYRKDKDRYDPEIRMQNKRCHLGYSKTLEEAVYRRYVAEELVFEDYVREEEHEKARLFTQNLPQNEKERLEKIVKAKLKAKGLWQ